MPEQRGTEAPWEEDEDDKENSDTPDLDQGERTR